MKKEKIITIIKHDKRCSKFIRFYYHDKMIRNDKIMIKIYYHDKNLSPHPRENLNFTTQFLILKFYYLKFDLIQKGGNGIIR